MIAIDQRHGDYLSDESHFTGMAEYISFPTTVEEVVDTIKKSEELDIPLTIQGSNTGITGASVPMEGGILNLSKLNKILSLKKNKKGYLLKVEAGTTLGEINKFLKIPKAFKEWSEEEKNIFYQFKKDGNFFFPPNPSEETATIGGMFATNARGSNALRYGAVSEYITKLEMVTAKGEIVSFKPSNPSSDEVENNSTAGSLPISYFAQSEGTLGVFTKMELQLLPQPDYYWGVHFFFQKNGVAEAFCDFVANLSDEDMAVISIVEYFDENSLAILREGRSQLSTLKGIGEIPEKAVSSIYVELAGEDEEILSEILLSLLGDFMELGGKDEYTWANDNLSDIEKFHKLRHALPELLNMKVAEVRKEYPSFTKLATDFKGPKEKFSEYLKNYQTDIEKINLEGYVFGHILENHFHVNIIPKNDEENQKAQNLISSWGKKVLEDDGCLAYEHGYGKLKMPLGRELLSNSEKEYHKNKKEQWDPKNRLGKNTKRIWSD